MKKKQMKKLFLIATVSFVGFLSAKDTEEKKPSKQTEETKNEKCEKESTPQQYCQSYLMVVWCNSSANAVDTVCYELGDADSKAHAYACMRENGALYNEYVCGSPDYGG